MSTPRPSTTCNTTRSTAVARQIVDEHLWPSRTLDLDRAVAALAPLLA